MQLDRGQVAHHERAVEVVGVCPNFAPSSRHCGPAYTEWNGVPMDVYVLLIIATFAPGEERAEEYRTYYSLAHCERHARALRREGSAERYKIKFECRSLKSYTALMPSPKA